MKSDLGNLFLKCSSDKKFSNNLSFEVDSRDLKKDDDIFSIYEDKKGQVHEAGYDAFMTGVVFGRFAKYIEIGNILNVKT